MEIQIEFIYVIHMFVSFHCIEAIAIETEECTLCIVLLAIWMVPTYANRCEYEYTAHRWKGSSIYNPSSKNSVL